MVNSFALGWFLGNIFKGPIADATHIKWFERISKTISHAPPTKPPGVIGGVIGGLAGIFATSVLGSGVTNNLLDPDRAKKGAGRDIRNALLGGTAIGGLGSIFGMNNLCQERLDQVIEAHEEHRARWNSKLLKLKAYNEKSSTEREMRYNENIASLEEILATKVLQLNETTSSLRELQHRHERQYVTFVGVIAGLLGATFILVIVGFCQTLTHHRERHRLVEASHVQHESSQKEKLQQQEAKIEELKRMLEVAAEEQKRYPQHIQWGHPHPSTYGGGQPLILNLPPNLLSTSNCTSSSSEHS